MCLEQVARERGQTRHRLTSERNLTFQVELGGAATTVLQDFLAKVLGPIIGYGTDFELLQFVYDLHMWTVLGGKKNACHDVPMRVLLKGSPFSPAST